MLKVGVKPKPEHKPRLKRSGTSNHYGNHMPRKQSSAGHENLIKPIENSLFRKRGSNFGGEKL